MKHKIGTQEVFPEQIYAARALLNACKRGVATLLVAQMQQGKTGSCQTAIEDFITECKRFRLTYEVFYLINISCNDIKDQTERRLWRSKHFGNPDLPVQLLHLADLVRRKYTVNHDVDRRLVIVDECQEALDRSNSRKAKPFHSFMSELGIEYGEPVSQWENKNNWVISTSATPFVHIVRQKINEHAFERVDLPVHEGYYALSDMQEAGRLFQSERLVEDGKATDFFIDRFHEFLDSCLPMSEEDGLGKMIVRLVGNDANVIENYINTNYAGILVRTFSDHNKNLNTLDEEIATPYPSPFVVIIKGALRAGKTLTTTKYINMWVETPDSKGSTACQAIGRCCGSPEADGRSKFEDTFPIYGNMKQIEVAINFFNGNDRSLPSAKGIKKLANASRPQYEIRYVPGNFRTFEEVTAWAASKVKIKGKPVAFGAQRCSTYKTMSVAHSYLDKVPRGYYRDANKKQRVYWLDGPHPIHTKDWDKLPAKALGTAFYFEKIGEFKPFTNDNLDDKVIFKNQTEHARKQQQSPNSKRANGVRRSRERSLI